MGIERDPILAEKKAATDFFHPGTEKAGANPGDERTTIEGSS